VPLDQLDALQIGADREDERLAGDADTGDGAVRRLLLHLVDGGVQIGQRLRAERGRLGVVQAVVQGDQREAPGARQVQVPHLGTGDDLAGEQLGRALQQLGGGAHLPLPFPSK
jgi:hypothetical protein